VLRVSGDEDRTTSGRRRRPISAALQATKDVVVDLSDLTFADASVMLDLAVLARRLRLRGRMLRLTGQRPQIQALIELVGLDRQPAVAVEPLPANS
jgi:anti-anti-sigma factor